MNIFIFNPKPAANCGHFRPTRVASILPAQFRPWHAVGVVKPDAAPPNNLSRDVIEKSIADTGYQLWKLKPAKA